MEMHIADRMGVQIGKMLFPWTATPMRLANAPDVRLLRYADSVHLRVTVT
jgi:hypothetical protein